jgi:hypothetical protein
LFAGRTSSPTLKEHISIPIVNMAAAVDPATRKKVLRVIFFSLLLDLVRMIPHSGIAVVLCFPGH